jgi:dienelactone hydrolase
VLGFLRQGAHIRTILILLAGVAVGGCASDAVVPTPAPAAEATGMLSFPTAGSLQRGANGRFFMSDASAGISGELRFPEGTGPFPAIVLAHGCNGLGNGGIERNWGPVLRGWGYATFNVDSFRGRGIREVCTQVGVLVPLQRVPDAYGALRLLAAHPRIDPARIALMGFSHGGALTMLASTAWAKEAYAPRGAPSFRAFIPFYPNCNGVFPERMRVAAPVRIHTGEADDWTPARPCAELAASLRAAAQDVAIHVYPGAHHGFDQALPRVIHRPDVNNGAGCYPRSPSILGPVARASVAGCLKKGATIAGSPSAADQARRNLRMQLDQLMR